MLDKRSLDSRTRRDNANARPSYIPSGPTSAHQTGSLDRQGDHPLHLRTKQEKWEQFHLHAPRPNLQWLVVDRTEESSRGHRLLRQRH